MAYDLVIKNGLIVDGSGMPAFRGDVAVKDGKIAETGKLSGAAGQTVDVGGQVIAPGFIDNHCHYDAQVTWDPLCTFSCDHGATSVVIGNCSLSLAPVRRGNPTRRGGTSRAWGPTRRRSSRSPTYCARWAPASSSRAAAATPRWITG